MMLTQSKADGTYLKTLQSLAKTELLIINDWGLELLKAVQRNDLMELMELMDDRHGHASTIMLSQLPTDQWHQSIGDTHTHTHTHNTHTNTSVRAHTVTVTSTYT